MDKASLLLLVFYNIFFILPVCASNDTLTQSQSLTVEQTLLSADKTFELGFFSPGNASELYIGIRYKNDTDRRIVWVANRRNGLLASDRKSRLIISSDANLKLIDGKQHTVWSTNSSTQAKSTIAVLGDNGNFILKDNVSGESLWESFNYPSETLLEGMQLGFNSKTGERTFLTSWEGENDPAPGNFVAGLSDEKPPQAFTWINGTKPYWRGGPWNGWQYIGIHDSDKGYANNIIVTPNNQMGDASMTFNTFNKSYSAFMTLSPIGMLQILHWEGQNHWKPNWGAPQHPCEVYGSCGPFSACSRSRSTICECLKGFIPFSDEEWSKENWTQGCVRQRQPESMCVAHSSNLTLKVSEPDGFLKLSQMKLPDKYMYLFDENDQEGCRQRCLSNCSCQAYAYPEGINCLVWVTDLVDIEQYPDGGEDLYLRLANSEIGVKKQYAAIIISVLSISVGSLLGLLLYCVMRRKPNRRAGRTTHKHLHEQKSETRKWWIIKDLRIKCIVKSLFLSKKEGTLRDLSPEDMQEDPASTNGSSELPMINFNRIKNATNNFNEANKLGEGGFGTVYKGRLEDGQEIAVKRLLSQSGQGTEEFKNEVKLISKLQHRNLVRLLGCCTQGEENILILEYMKNISLDTFLFDKTKRLELDWAKRFNIIHGIARGLLYLHRDSCLRIIHRDLKASNILLDDDLNPKISDFGLARTFRVTQELDNTRRVVGTLGHMSPEYAMGGLFSEKSDVYSFGVLLLEIVSGKKNTGFGYHEKYLSLLDYAWQLWNEGKASNLLDQSLADFCTPSEVKRCIQIGLLCVQDHAADRPTMSNVLHMLSSSESEMEIPQPRQPTFTSQSFLESGQFRSRFCMCNVSINEVSISIVEGR